MTNVTLNKTESAVEQFKQYMFFSTDCLCYYNVSRDYKFQNHNFTIKLYDGNNRNNRTKSELFLCSSCVVRIF